MSAPLQVVKFLLNSEVVGESPLPKAFRLGHVLIIAGLTRNN